MRLIRTLYSSWSAKSGTLLAKKSLLSTNLSALKSDGQINFVTASFRHSFFREGTTWSKTDLPLMPRVAFAHQELKKALKKCEGLLPEEFVRDISTVMGEVRAINWRSYNSSDLSIGDGLRLKRILQRLYAFETKLPPALNNELQSVAVFESLYSAIECLDERSGYTDAQARYK